VTSFGILTIGGVIAMFLGSIMLFDQTPGFPVMVDWRVALTVALATAAFFVFALGMAVKARLTQPKTGLEGLIGEIGEALTIIKDHGSVAVHGEIWQAESAEPIKKGEKIIVRAVNGLIMTVEKFKK